MKTAVLVIDVQTTLFDPEPQPFEAGQVIANINIVTQWARTKSYPVIFVQHERADTIIEYKSGGWQLQQDLVTLDDDILIRKTTPDSFLHTDLQQSLKQHQINHLVVCGYASEFCVDTTIRRAAGLGYSVELVADAHTTHDKPHASADAIRSHHNHTLPNIASFGVTIAAISTLELIRG